MKAKARITLLVATAFATLLLPGAAIARTRPASRHPKPPREQLRPEVNEQFALIGTNGFEITLDVTDRRRLRLTALKWGNVIESASYSLRLRPRRSPDAIVARLGRLGRIDVRFIPRKIHREKPPRGCHGAKTVIEQGRFVGVIAFRGEHGFTEVNDDRAPGAITRTPALSCPATASPPDPKKLRRQLKALERAEAEVEDEGEEDEGLSVRLSATARGGRVTLGATKVVLKEKHAKPLSLTNILVTGRRHRGRIAEQGVAGYIFGKGSTFLVPNRDKPSSEGVLKPPAPFSGSAIFQRHRVKPPTWTGDLKIDLPGFGPVRLAGPGTSASMCDGLACQLRGLLSGQRLLRRAGRLMGRKLRL
jgi:hypothetical protein